VLGLLAGTLAGVASGEVQAADQRLLDSADVAVTGVVGSGWETVAGEMAPVDTLVPIAVESALKGTPATTVKVRLPGGILPDGTELSNSEAPRFTRGERVKAFLTRRSDGGYAPVPGGIVHESFEVQGTRQHNPGFERSPDPDVRAVCNNDKTATAPLGYSGFALWPNGLGNHRVWAGSSMTFFVNTSFASRSSALDMVAAKWNAAGGSFTISNGGLTTISAGDHADGVTVAGYGAMYYSTSVAETWAVTNADGSIIESDVVYDQTRAFSDGTALPSAGYFDTVMVGLHEFGHLLGFEHVRDSAQIMWPCVAPGDSVRTLGWGDLAGHRNFYPSDNFGYWLADEAGAVFALGGYGAYTKHNTQHYGSPNNGNVIGYPTNKVTDFEPARPTRDGYLVLASNGGVFAYGGAKFKGSAVAYRCATCTITDMAVHPTGDYYWVLGSDGGVYGLPADVPGTPFYGSVVGVINGPAVGIAATPDGGGYWIVSDKGNVYAKGNAQFYGGGIPAAAQPAKGIIGSTSGAGYVVIGANGQTFPFGDGSAFGPPITSGTRKIARDPHTNAFVTVASDGTVRLGGAVPSYGRGTTATPYAAIAANRAPLAPTLTQSASPASLTVRRGQSGTSSITVTSNDAFYANVSFSVSGLPSGVTASFSPNPIMLPSSASRSTTLTVSVSTAYVGTGFTLNVNGCGQGLCRTSTIAVVVPVV
jgi:hypothetical protein